ncbi:MAG: SDR family oxidoreductase [Deltaproteobacteria bacterium]|nr:SDR family oxidoreductase [Deltaproteobacteria bacterium]
MTGPMTGKVALVTGATSGIGRATALAFAKEGAWVVAVGDSNVAGGKETVALVEGAGSQGLFVKCNVSKKEEVQHLILTTLKEFGRLDYACNNAGVQQQMALLAEIDEAEWDRIIAINLRGVFLCMKYEIQQMVKQGNGVIVNISSMGGLAAPSPGLSSYIASKHGVIGLTKAAAIEYARTGIRVNTVCPGVIETGMTAQFAAKASEEMMQLLVNMHPVGRFGKPEEVACAVIWLCSDLAAFVTGSSVVVDGGVTAQ